MASDYWSERLLAVGSCRNLNISMKSFFLVFFLSLVLAVHGDDSPGTRNDIFNHHPQNQIILQPETSSSTPKTDKHELNFVLCSSYFTLSLT